MSALRKQPFWMITTAVDLATFFYKLFRLQNNSCFSGIEMASVCYGYLQISSNGFLSFRLGARQLLPQHLLSHVDGLQRLLDVEEVLLLVWQTNTYTCFGFPFYCFFKIHLKVLVGFQSQEEIEFLSVVKKIWCFSMKLQISTLQLTANILVKCQSHR